MRLSRLILGAALTLAVASTALAQKVKTDYDKNTNFTQYKTFAWIKQPKTTDPLMAQRVVEEVNAALAAKGLQLVTNGNADLVIAAHAATQQEHTLNTFYDGFGGGWGWRRFGGGGFGTATTTDTPYEVGTLVIDMFDAKTKEAIWRGTSTKTLSDNPEKNAKALNEGITKMFKNFPPTAKKT